MERETGWPGVGREGQGLPGPAPSPPPCPSPAALPATRLFISKTHPNAKLGETPVMNPEVRVLGSCRILRYWLKKTRHLQQQASTRSNRQIKSSIGIALKQLTRAKDPHFPGGGRQTQHLTGEG